MSCESIGVPSVQATLPVQTRSHPSNSIDEVLAKLWQPNTPQERKQKLPDFAHPEPTLLGIHTHQLRLLQSEKISSLGQIAAGVAHEINNPASFIYGNLFHVRDALGSLLSLLQLYQKHCPVPSAEIQTATEELDLEFLQEDLPKMLASMEVGADRIRQIVRSLRNFSRLGEAQLKSVDLHEGLDSTLAILKNRLNSDCCHPEIEILSEYENLPAVECYASQINQVFLASISRAIASIHDAYRIRYPSLHQDPPYPSWDLEKHSKFGHHCDRPLRGKIRISTHRDGDSVVVSISDNGLGILEKVKRYLIDPSLKAHLKHQSKSVGLAVAHQVVVEQHGGQFKCILHAQQGTQFLISLPIHQASPQSIHCTRENCDGCHHPEC